MESHFYHFTGTLNSWTLLTCLSYHFLLYFFTSSEVFCNKGVDFFHFMDMKRHLSVPRANDVLTNLELLDGVVQPPALHFSSVKLVLLLRYSLFETVDLLLGVPEGLLYTGQGGLLH